MTKQSQFKYAFKDKRERRIKIVHGLKPMDGWPKSGQLSQGWSKLPRLGLDLAMTPKLIHYQLFPMLDERPLPQYDTHPFRFP
jgi:hypothetical protein